MATPVAVPPRSLPEAVSSGLWPRPEWSATRRWTMADAGAASAAWRGAEMNHVVLALLPLVKRLALQMRERLPLHVEADDLIGTGALGLVDAVRKFDARKQVRLEQYARHRIRGAILDGLRTLDPASRDMRRKSKRAECVYARLEGKLGHAPSDLQMAQGLGITLASWYRTVRELRAVGLDWLRPLGSVGTQEAKAVCEDSLAAKDQGDQFDACYRRERKEILDRALERIPQRERQVVQLYYRQELTMREIGERLGIDESRVSQLHSAALVRLRKRVKDLLQHPTPALPRLAW